MKLTFDMFTESGRCFEARKPIPILTLKKEFEDEAVSYVFADAAVREAFEGKELALQVGLTEIVTTELFHGDKAAAPTREQMEKEWGTSENYFSCDAILVTEGGLYLGIAEGGAIAPIGGVATYKATSYTDDDNNGAGYKEGHAYTATFAVALHYCPSIWDKTTLYRNRAYRELCEFTVPEGIVKIGKKAFAYCEKLEKVTLPKGLRIIDDCAFDHCKALTEIALPEGLKEIGYDAFCSCTSLGSVAIPRSVMYIKAGAFRYCESLTEFTLPDGFCAVPDSLLQHCQSLVRVTLPKDITYIGRYAFYDCTALADITLPEGLLEIADNAFEKCTALCGLVIPKSVKTIGWGALYGPKNTVYPNKK